MKPYRPLAALALFLSVMILPFGRLQAADPWAAWRWTSFASLGEAIGLPHITTTAVVRARDGTMWIGTRGGLTRYDGQRVRTFKQRQTDPHSLPDNYVRSLMALPGGGVLIGTNVGGLARYDPQRDAFIRLKPTHGAIGARIFSFTPDGAGGAYIGSDGGVHHYIARLDRVDPMTDSAIPSPDGRPQGAFAVFRDGDGTLWAGSDHGLWRRAPGMRPFTHVPLGAHKPSGDVWSILRDRRGRLWVGTGSNGVYLSENGDPRHFVQLPTLTSDAPLIGHRTIRAFVEDRLGRIWIATDGMGIVLLDPARGFAASGLRHDTGNPLALAGDTVRALAMDDGGGIWAATELGASRTQGPGGGVLRIGSAMHDPRLSLADDNVRGVLVDRRQQIWLGFSNGSVDRLDRAAGQVRHLALAGHHAGQDIKALLESSDGSILIGARGVVAIDPRTLATHDLAIPELGDLPVISLAETKRDLLIGTYKGLYKRDRATGRVTVYRHDPADPRSLPNNEVINILPRPDGQVLVATPGGIGQFDPRSGRFVCYANRANDPYSLPQDYVGSMVPDGRRLWVGTYGGVALGRTTRDGWKFRAIGEAQGLAGDNVASLTRDSRRRLWTASAGGISVIDPTSLHVLEMSQRDGMPMRAFNQRAAATMNDGSLLFGSPEGLMVLQPDLLLERRDRSDTAQLIVSQADINGRLLAIDSVARDPVVHLDRQGRTLRLGFSLTDYAAPEEIRYRYRLEGFDVDWMTVPAGTPATAIYTNLPSGDYWLTLSAHVPGLAARTVTRQVRITVDPQWYETWPARIGLSLLLLVSIGGAFWLVTAVIRRRADMLEAIVAERTSALRVANAQLDRLASTDPLTGLANRRTLMNEMEQAAERACRSGGGFAFALLDLDHFKRINDEHGHSVGDAVLVEVARRIQGAVRAKDCVVRYGGEEIAILFPDTGLEIATAIVERLRRQIAESPVMAEHGPVPVTMSAGGAHWRAGNIAGDLMRRADEALYRAKRGGRDRVEQARDLERADG